MKIKRDFVTNSSSTSFCAWGIASFYEYDDKNYLPEKLLKRSYNYYLEKIPEYKSNNLYKYKGESEPVSFEIFCYQLRKLNPIYTDFVTNYLNTLNISSIFFREDEEGCYIGRSPFSIRDDENPKSFKTILKLDLIKLGFENPRLECINEEVYH